jgi:Predicted integral membrane protein
MAIRNPIEWIFTAPSGPVGQIGTATPGEYWQERARDGDPQVQRVGWGDIRIALGRGVEDFKANRTDVVMLAIIYPIAVLLGVAAMARHAVIPMVFPVVSGFTLIGPLATIWLAELSRRREAVGSASLADAAGVFRSPQIGAILALGACEILLYFAWIATAAAIFRATIGPAMPATIGGFVSAVFETPAGWTLIVAGVGTGFVFALIGLVVGCVSMPLLLDRHVSVGTAVAISVRAFRTNPGTILAWGFVVVTSVVLGAIPLLFGLVVVVPILGHATWHLYRRIVAN